MYISNDRVLNLVTYIQWEKTQVIEYDKICNGLKALSEMLSIYSYIIINNNLQLSLKIVSIAQSNKSKDNRKEKPSAHVSLRHQCHANFCKHLRWLKLLSTLQNQPTFKHFHFPEVQFTRHLLRPFDSILHIHTRLVHGLCLTPRG